MIRGDWVVTSDTPDKNNPMTAFVLCVVTLKEYTEYSALFDLLKKENLIAFADKSYGKHFWSRTTRPAAITLDEFKTKLSEPRWRYTHV